MWSHCGTDYCCFSFDALPWWPNLTHFKAVMSVDFNDGSFHEDISKVQVQTLNMLYSVLTQSLN
jgi:hypothetical protein